MLGGYRDALEKKVAIRVSAAAVQFRADQRNLQMRAVTPSMEVGSSVMESLGGVAEGARSNVNIIPMIVRGCTVIKLVDGP